MNVEIEKLNNCEILLRIEMPAERVETEWKKLVRHYTQQAKIPGFRPGKAPRAIVESKFGEQIRLHLNERLTQTALDEAIKAKELRVLGIRSVKDNEVGADRIFRCAATCVVEPEFTLPDYKHLTVTVPAEEVTEERLEQTLEGLRAAHASYHPIEGRPLAEGDFAVITYEGFFDGQRLKDLLPEAPPLIQGRQSFWLEIKGDQFLPGFIPALRGQKIGETRQVHVTLPETYHIETLRGKALSYQVTLDAINQRVLPEWNDELAALILPGKNLAELREHVRARLQTEADELFRKRKENAVFHALLQACEFDPPEDLVFHATNRAVEEIVREGQAAGMSDEELKDQYEKILSLAQLTASERVKIRLILHRIARAEKITVSQSELLQSLALISQNTDVPMPKLIKDFRKNDRLQDLQENILVRKALKLVCDHATVQSPSV